MPPERSTPQTRLLEAQDPETPAQRLREIARMVHSEGEAAVAVAVHPNTPPDVLAALARSIPDVVLRNPVLPLVLLEDPGWADRLQPKTALSMLRSEDVPEMLLYALAGQTGPVGQAARLHVGLAGEAGADWEAEAREALWEAVGLSIKEEPFPTRLLSLDLTAAWLAEPLAAHGDAHVRRAVARSNRTPRGVLTLLRRAGSTSDLGGLAPPDPTLTGPVLDRMARGGPWARRLAARHPNTPVSALEHLAQFEDPGLRRHLVQNPSTPAPLRASLAVSLDFEFRRASARDPLTPAAALAKLASDAVRDVRWMAARNPGTPHPALTALAGDADARVRQGVGRNAAAPADLLASLARDPVRWVRLAAVRHPNSPGEVLAELTGDEDEEVRRAVARRHGQATPVDRGTKRPAPPAPPEQMQVAVIVAHRPRRSARPPVVSPAKALDEAAGKGGWLGMAAVLSCPETSPKYIAGGADSEHWACRLAVARNPSAFLFALEQPGFMEVLGRLARDGNRLVRAAARAALPQGRLRS